MTTRQWKLVVTEIGTASPVAETVVEAPNWMAGIKLARGRIGEPESIPQGASCTVAPDGRVTVFDAARRRSYVLTPLADGGLTPSTVPGGLDVSYPPGVYTASQVPHAPAAPSPTAYASHGVPSGAAAPSTARQRPKTMAYILDGPLPPPPGMQPVPAFAPPQPQPRATQPDGGRVETVAFDTRTSAPAQPPAAAPPVAAPPAPRAESTVPFETRTATPAHPAAEPPPSGRAAMKRTMAFIPGQFDLPPLPTREVVVGSKPAAAVAPVVAPQPAPQPATPETPAGPRVLFERDVPPSEESPLHYHVVGLLSPGEGSTVELERAMHGALARTLERIEGPHEGHFVQVFAYREPLDEPRDGAEVAQLQWRGWRAESAVRFPQLEAQIATQVIPGAERYPSAAADPRLTDLLDAFEDVWFLASPEAGLEFAARVLEDLFPGSHVVCAGLDVGGNGFVPASLRGTLPGYDAPPLIEPTGLVQIALAGGGRPVAFPDPIADSRIDVVAEGVGTGPMLAAVAPHSGEALGYVRIARAKTSAPFTLIDAEILRAMVERLGLFLRLRGACIEAGV